MNKTKKSILISNPVIAKDWDVQKNISLDIKSVSATDKNPIWWCCENRHSYSVSPYTRIRTNGCKYCNKEKNSRKNLLQVRLLSGKSKRFSDVASSQVISEWAKDLNNIQPDQITSHSRIKINWRCSNGHVWEGTPKSRISGTGCPDCYKLNRINIILESKLKKSGSTLFQKYPYLANEWDYNKNHLDPNKLTPNSNYKAFWKCKFNHFWEASIYNRTGNGSGCPECSGSGTSKLEIYILCELRTIFSEVYWRKKIDTFEVDIYVPQYSFGIEVDGEYWHKNKVEKDKKKSIHLESKGIDLIRVRSDRINDVNDLFVIVKGYSNTDDFQDITNKIAYLLEKKIKNTKLSEYCLRKAQVASKDYQQMISRLPAPPEGESFLAVYPDVAVEWDYDNNAPLTPDLFTPKSDQKFWWICKEKHSWQATIKNRTLRRSNCPDCFDERRSEDSIKRNRDRLGSIGEKYPELVCFWDRQNNTEVDPNLVTAVQTNSYSWICNRLHTFTRQLKVMIKDQSCKHCHSIKETHPELFSEWDYSKNAAVDPIEITQGSDKPLWWVCKNGHSWSSSVVRKIKDNKKCHVCLSLGFRFPSLLNEWDFEKNTEIDPMVVHAGTTKKAWWKCLHGHQWETSIEYRTGDKKSNCPTCGRKIAAEKTRLMKLGKSGSLQDNFPELSIKWNQHLNKDLTPNNISSNSHMSVWWIYNCGNNFKQTPNHMVTLFKRKSSYGCGNCS